MYFLIHNFCFLSNEAFLLNGNVDSRVTDVGVPEIPVQIKKLYFS